MINCLKSLYMNILSNTSFTRYLSHGTIPPPGNELLISYPLNREPVNEDTKSTSLYFSLVSFLLIFVFPIAMRGPGVHPEAVVEGEAGLFRVCVGMIWLARQYAWESLRHLLVESGIKGKSGDVGGRVVGLVGVVCGPR